MGRPGRAVVDEHLAVGGDSGARCVRGAGHAECRFAGGRVGRAPGRPVVQQQRPFGRGSDAECRVGARHRVGRSRRCDLGRAAPRASVPSDGVTGVVHEHAERRRGARRNRRAVGPAGDGAEHLWRRPRRAVPVRGRVDLVGGRGEGRRCACDRHRRARAGVDRLRRRPTGGLRHDDGVPDRGSRCDRVVRPEKGQSCGHAHEQCPGERSGRHLHRCASSCCVSFLRDRSPPASVAEPGDYASQNWTAESSGIVFRALSRASVQRFLEVALESSPTRGSTTRRGRHERAISLSSRQIPNSIPAM